MREFPSGDYTPFCPAGLDALGNVVLGQHERPARNSDDTFAFSTVGSEGELPFRGFGDVEADDGEIAVRQFENIRAVVEFRSRASAGVRIETEAAGKFHVRPFTLVKSSVKGVFPEFVRRVQSKDLSGCRKCRGSITRSRARPTGHFHEQDVGADWIGSHDHQLLRAWL